MLVVSGSLTGYLMHDKYLSITRFPLHGGWTVRFLFTILFLGVSMSFHLLAFAGGALDASAGNVTVNAVPEQLFNIAANRFRMPRDFSLMFAYAGSIGLTRARVVTPRFRVPAVPHIFPINEVLIVPTNYGLMDFRDKPLTFGANDDVEVQATNGAANTVIALLGVTDNPTSRELPFSDLRWVRATSVVTGGTLTWGARGEIIFEDTLDSGTYGVYGMQLSTTTPVAGRLIFNNQYMRPGSIGMATMGLIPRDPFLGGMGLWGTFENSTPPGLELMQTTGAAVTAELRILIKHMSR